jgi:hypothetical protein
MLKASPNSIPYHGWRVEVVPQPQGFVFCCYHPDLPDFFNDGLLYCCFKDALMAGCRFIDREIAIQSLLHIVGDWWLGDRISDEEYWSLTNFD